MSELKKYVKKVTEYNTVVAIQLKLRLPEGLMYNKWGNSAAASEGCWLVENNGEVYTVETESFAKTYRKVGKGLYIKTAPVWATKTTSSGAITTKEGKTCYRAGDYIVSNSKNGGDSYAAEKEIFEAMYELVG